MKINVSSLPISSEIYHMIYVFYNTLLRELQNEIYKEEYDENERVRERNFVVLQ